MLSNNVADCEVALNGTLPTGTYPCGNNAWIKLEATGPRG